MDTTVCSQCGNPRPVVRKPANLRQALWGGWTCPYCENEFDRFGRLLTPQAPSTASDPGGLTISDEKLRVLKPELYGFFRNLSIRFGLDWDQLGYLREHLQNGDARAAVVVSVDPLRVAAYTDELDAVALLEFPPEFVEDYGLRVGSRLLTVNGYVNLHEPAADIAPGPRATGRWNGFHPIIADFVSDDLDEIDQRKATIPEEEWQRAFRLGKRHLTEWPDLVRDGRPIDAGVPAEGAEEG